jgi:hypothetical protein
MRDLQMLDEWLQKLRTEKRDAEHRYCLVRDGIAAEVCAQQVELLTKIIAGISILDRDAGEFCKRNLG